MISVLNKYWKNSFVSTWCRLNIKNSLETIVFVPFTQLFLENLINCVFSQNLMENTVFWQYWRNSIAESTICMRDWMRWTLLVWRKVFESGHKSFWNRLGKNWLFRFFLKIFYTFSFLMDYMGFFVEMSEMTVLSQFYCWRFLCHIEGYLSNSKA